MKGWVDRAKALFKSKLFWFVLIAKLCASVLFASDFLTRYFLPFVTAFVAHPFNNPYIQYAAILPEAFPYPSLMLFLLAIPLAIGKLFGSAGMADILLIRMPLILADIAIAIVFTQLLENRTRDILLYYWCSPVLFYISYVHGQLDALPIAILLLSLLLLFSRNKWNYLASFALFGAGIATKTSMLLALPFLLLYVWKQTRSPQKIFVCLLASGLVFLTFILPFLSEGFIRMVFISEQQARLLAFSLPVYSGLVLFIAPLAYLGLFFRFAGYRRITPDALMMILSLVFSIFMTLVPPRPGWFFWGIPFIIYFFIRFDNLRRFTFWALNLAYFLFFWTWIDSDLPQLFQLIAPHFAREPNLYSRFVLAGLPAGIISSITFTFLAATILVVSYWIYRYGIRRNDETFIRNKPFCIGIGGDSATGKTTLSELLVETLGRVNVTIINGDDMHKWERGNENWQKVTHLNPQGNRLHLDYKQALQLANGKPIYRKSYDHTTGTFTKPERLEPTRFVLFSGLHPFYLKGMRQMQDLKIFLEPEERLRKQWKINRDQEERGHTRTHILAALKKRKPDTNKYIKPQREFADIIISFLANNSFSIRMDNSVDAELIQQAFAPIPGLRIEHNYDEDCEHQTLIFQGVASSSAIRAAYILLVPDHDLIPPNSLWKTDLNGVLQVLLTHQIYLRLRGEQRDI